MSTTRRRARGTKSRRVNPPMPRSARAPPAASLVSDSDQLLQLLGVGGDHAVYVLDAEGKIATWNPGAERLTGYRSDEVLGRDAALFLPPEAAKSGKAQSDLAIARASGRLEEEGWQVRKGGERYWADVVLTAIFDDQGRLWGYLKTVRDLSERRAAAEDLWRSEERLRLLVEAVQDYAIFMLDPEGRVATWNSGAQRLNGYRAEEVIGRHFKSLYLPEDAAAGKAEREMQIARERGRVEDEGWRIRKDGTRYWANVVLTAVRDASGQLRGFAKVTRDMTERRKAEEAVAARAREQAAIARLSLEALRMTDVTEAMRQAVHAVAATLDVDIVEVLELSADQQMFTLRACVGRPESDLGLGVRAAGPESASGLALETDAAVFVSDLPSEQRFPPRPDLLARKVVSSLTVPIHGESPEAPYGVLSAHCNEWREFTSTDAAYLSAIANVLATAIARVRAEERVRDAKQQMELQQVQREQAEQALQQRDEFLGVAAHELRTPITALRLRLQSLEQSLRRGTAGGKDEVAEKISRSMRNTTRLAVLVERLLDVSRIVGGRLTLNLEPVDLVEAAADVLEDVKEQAAIAGSDLKLEARAHPRAEVDLLRIEQVLTNLVGNAIKYGAGQPVEVVVDQQGEQAVITVHDYGIGIAPQDLERIFNRFERVAPSNRYAGLGLGLYISRRVVDAHGGTISATGAEGKGATFEVRLPLRHSGAAGAA
jgi:PAS domain S-box-containing protein